MPRLAWFTPLPPVRSGIAQYNWELLPAVARSHSIDLYVDGAPDGFRAPGEQLRIRDAHDFVWRQRQQPYDLVVYQLGNAPCHDYMWAYVARYPGLVVLHDGQLHHARGRMLLQRWRPRRDDYRQEFWFNHPDARKDVAELGAEGLLGSLTYLWPMLRVVIEASRRVAVHNGWLAEQIGEAFPAARTSRVEMGVPAPAPSPGARARVRARHGIPDAAVVFTAFGRVTPEKRVREALRALASVAAAVPDAHVLMAGETVEYYDMAQEARSLGIEDRVTIAGYVQDDEMDDYLDASDVCLCMRWPTSRETSASWLRCLAAGKPTISTDLVHTVDIPTLDPRSWSVLSGGADTEPVGVGIDILDEDHSLKLAIRRLASDDKLRTTLGTNARTLWARRFGLERMSEGYQQAITLALNEAPATDTRPAFPVHLRSTGAEHAEALVREIVGAEYHLRDAD